MNDPLPPYEDIDVKLTAHLLGELGEEQAREVEARLAEDEALKKLYQELKASIDLMQEAAQVGLCATSVDDKAPVQLSEDRRQSLFKSFRKAETESAPSTGKVERGIPWYVPMGVAAALIALMAVSSIMLKTKSAMGSMQAALASYQAKEKLSEAEPGQTTELFSNVRVPVSFGRGEDAASTDYYFMAPESTESEEAPVSRGAQRQESLSRLAQVPTSGTTLQSVNDKAQSIALYAVTGSAPAAELTWERESFRDSESKGFEANSGADKANLRLAVKKEIPAINPESRGRSRSRFRKGSSLANDMAPPPTASPMAPAEVRRQELDAKRNAEQLVAQLEADQQGQSQGVVDRFGAPQQWGLQVNDPLGRETLALEGQSRGSNRSLASQANGGFQKSSFGIELADAPTSGFSSMQRIAQQDGLGVGSLPALQEPEPVDFSGPAPGISGSGQMASGSEMNLSLARKGQSISVNSLGDTKNAPTDAVRGYVVNHFDVPSGGNIPVDQEQGAYNKNTANFAYQASADVQAQGAAGLPDGANGSLNGVAFRNDNNGGAAGFDVTRYDGRNFGDNAPMGGISANGAGGFGGGAMGGMGLSHAGGIGGGGGSAGGGGPGSFASDGYGYSNPAGGLPPELGRAAGELSTPDNGLSFNGRVAANDQGMGEPAPMLAEVVNQKSAEFDDFASVVLSGPASDDSLEVAALEQQVADLDFDARGGRPAIAEKRLLEGVDDGLIEDSGSMTFSKAFTPAPSPRSTRTRQLEEEQQGLVERELVLGEVFRAKDRALFDSTTMIADKMDAIDVLGESERQTNEFDAGTRDEARKMAQVRSGPAMAEGAEINSAVQESKMLAAIAAEGAEAEKIPDPFTGLPMDDPFMDDNIEAAAEPEPFTGLPQIALKQAKPASINQQLFESLEQSAPDEEFLGYKREDSALPQLGKKLASNKPQPDANVEHRPEQDAKEEPISTFSLNVSDVSFKLAQAALDQGQLPDPESIRSEQFLNAFDYRDPAPFSGQEIGFNWEVARHPFAHHRDILRLALKTAARGREAGRSMSLTLLLDNSGSMERSDRREILRQALDVLSRTLGKQDKISVVSFARTARLWVDGVPGGSPGSVLEPVRNLAPQGGTNLEEALNVAYEVAQNHFLEDGVNRVILLTDGAANLGNVDPETLKQKVETERRRGVAFDCFGIGWDGLNDPMLESLSRNGDGRYAFLNDPTFAGHEFADRLAGALNVAASDVKVQVEFNADRVGNWRQVGYAKHQLTKEQFRDNTVDAAEIAAAEAGNALYVIEPKENGTGPIGVVRVRFREPHTNQYHEKEWTVPFRSNIPDAGESSPSMKLAMASSLFGEWLNGNPHAGSISIRDLKQLLDGVPEAYGKDPRPQTLDRMLEQARQIGGL